MQRLELVGPSGVGKTTAYLTLRLCQTWREAGTFQPVPCALPRAAHALPIARQRVWARAAAIAVAPDAGCMVWDEGPAQQALVLAQLALQSRTLLYEYIDALPVDASVTYAVFLGDAAHLARRVRHHTHPILTRPFLDRVCAATDYLVNRLQQRGARVCLIPKGSTRPFTVRCLLDALNTPPLSGQLGVRAIPVAVFAEWIATSVPVAFSRWGDGEWQAIFGVAGATCDGQVYSGALRSALSAVLQRPSMVLRGLQPLAWRRYRSEIQGWLARRRLSVPWIDADVFAQASKRGHLDPLIDALRQRPTILVGPPHLRGLTVLSQGTFIPVAPTDAFAGWKATLTDILYAAKADPSAVICLSTGPAAKLLIDAGYHARPDLTWLDCGSLWDPYVGMDSRSYHAAVISRLGVEHE